jgi:hypothetical protein
MGQAARCRASSVAQSGEQVLASTLTLTALLSAEADAAKQLCQVVLGQARADRTRVSLQDSLDTHAASFVLKRVFQTIAAIAHVTAEAPTTA